MGRIYKLNLVKSGSFCCYLALKTNLFIFNDITNKPNFRHSIRYLLKKIPTDFLAILETHADSARAGRICNGLRFEYSFRVEVNGKTGGIWLLWRSGIGDVQIREISIQFIHAKVLNGEETMNVIAVYVAPTAERRSDFCDQLRDTIRGLEGPVVVGGDFNTIARVDEKTDDNGRLSADSIAFGDWINDLSLIDRGFQGNKFT